MKKIILGTILALALLGSCMFQSDGGDDKGAVSMKFALATAKGEVTPTAARIWVYSDNTLLANKAATAYYNTALVNGSGTVTISELPPGNSYRLVVAAGTASEDGTYFTTLKYGMSDEFPIKAGVETSVAMTLDAISTSYKAEPGMKSVVVTDGSIVAASSSAVYTGSSISTLTSAGSWSASNGTINSLSLGYTSSTSTYFPMANTTNGVYILSEGTATLKGGTIAPVTKDGKVIDSNGALQSGSYDDVFFFQGERQFGGLTGSDTSWTTVKLDFEGLSGKPIMDFFVIGDPASETSDVFGFFATKFVGSFRMGESFINSEDPPDVSDILDRDNSFLSFFGEGIPLIQCFGFTGDSRNTLYLGTKNGAYTTTASFAAGGTGLGVTPALLAGTKGINITKMVTRLFTTGTDTTTKIPAVAMLSSSELIVVKGGNLYRMPYVTGLVGTLTDIAWNGTKVVITGSLGVGEVETKALLPADTLVE